MGGKTLGDGNFRMFYGGILVGAIEIFEVAKVLKFSLACDIAVFLQRKLFRQITITSQPHGYNKFF